MTEIEGKTPSWNENDKRARTNGASPVDANLKQSAAYSCCARLRWELRPSFPLFSLEEPFDGRRIDVASSFAPPRPMCLTLLLRAFLLLWSVQVFIVDVRTYPPHNLYIYMGYLTHWGHFLTICYFFSSFLCSLLPSVVVQPPHGEEPHRLVQMAWGLYAIVAPLEVAITLLYWGALPTGPPTYPSVMEHGVLGVLVWIDGLVIGLVPVRLKHIMFLLGVCMLYLVWSVIDVILGIGGGEWGPAFDDDAIYPVLRWGSETKSAAIVSAFAMCVLTPSLFFGCWMLSLASSKTTKETNCCCCCCCCCCRGCAWDGSRRPLYQESDAADEVFDYNILDKAGVA